MKVTIQKSHLQADILNDEASCSVLPGSAAVSEGVWFRQDTARAAMVAPGGAATASSGVD